MWAGVFRPVHMSGLCVRVCENVADVVNCVADEAGETTPGAAAAVMESSHMDVEAAVPDDETVTKATDEIRDDMDMTAVSRDAPSSSSLPAASSVQDVVAPVVESDCHPAGAVTKSSTATADSHVTSHVGDIARQSSPCTVDPVQQDVVCIIDGDVAALPAAMAAMTGVNSGEQVLSLIHI